MSIVMHLNWQCKHLLADIKGLKFEHTQSVDLPCYHKFPEWKMYEYVQSVNSFLVRPVCLMASEHLSSPDIATAMEFPSHTPEHKVKISQFL